MGNDVFNCILYIYATAADKEGWADKQGTNDKGCLLPVDFLLPSMRIMYMVTTGDWRWMGGNVE